MPPPGLSQDYAHKRYVPEEGAGTMSHTAPYRGPLFRGIVMLCHASGPRIRLASITWWGLGQQPGVLPHSQVSYQMTFLPRAVTGRWCHLWGNVFSVTCLKPPTHGAIHLSQVTKMFISNKLLSDGFGSDSVTSSLIVLDDQDCTITDYSN